VLGRLLRHHAAEISAALGHQAAAPDSARAGALS